MSSTIPEFLPFKYKGILTVSEIIERSEDFAWKCRKYSKWKAVHTEKGDAKKLHRMADKLLSDKKVSNNDYQTICMIWEKVQRWRLDKSNFSIEPVKKKPWERLNALLVLADNNPEIITSKLNNYGVNVRELDSHIMTLVFVLILFVEYIGELKTPLDFTISRFDIKNIQNLKQINLYLNKVSNWFSKESAQDWNSTTSPDDIVSVLIKDLGLYKFDTQKHRELYVEDLPEFRLNEEIIQYGELEQCKLLEVNISKDITYITINNNHKLIKNIDKMDGREVAEVIIKAIGSAAKELITKEKCIEDFISYISLKTL